MKKSSKILILALVTLITIGCRNKNKPKYKDWNFDSIQHNNELYLFQTDDRFGEWGGNTYFIRIYSPYGKDELRMDYKEYEGNIGPPKPPSSNSNLKINWFSGQPIITEKLGLVVPVEELKIISNAIQQLIMTKVNNDEIVTMAGIRNRVIYSDSTLIIDDYPSTTWDEFQKLKRRITKE